MEDLNGVPVKELRDMTRDKISVKAKEAYSFV
jgi:hypothetical protein